eukprot:Colp12_sorted_trinity150504_noHs@3894
MTSQDKMPDTVADSSKIAVDGLKAKAQPAPRLVTPWVRTVQTGIDIIRNPKYNKGLAFTQKERQYLRIHGLMPPVVISQETQVMRVLQAIRKKATDLEKYQYLIDLQDRNEKLFYRVIEENLQEMMPIVYTPTVGEACMKYGHIFRRPRGMYISIEDRGRVFDMLKNWPEKKVKAIVVTDGERILGLGDLGAYGMGIPVGKLSLYTACAGVRPTDCLPVTIDVGTDNQALLDDPLYIGLRRRRERGPVYDALIDEFVEAAKRRFGPTTLIQFEDFGNSNAFRLLEKYRETCCTFNDDIQGTAAVALAGILSATHLTHTHLQDHTFLFLGAGEAALGIAGLMVQEMTQHGISEEDARKKIFLMDSKGLIVKDRVSGGITHHKAPYAHAGTHTASLVEAVRMLKPTALIGVSAIPQSFTQEVCEAMAENAANPIIFALSNPTSKAECSAEQAYTWTKGKAVFASGSPFPAFVYEGRRFEPGQGNNAYIFPGLALGVLAARARRVDDGMFLVAAKTLANLVTDDLLATGNLYPRLSDIKRVSRIIAVEVVKYAYQHNLASRYPMPAGNEKR